MANALVQLDNFFLTYQSDNNFSLNINHFSIEPDSRVFIEGPSGCGKTTFLNAITGLIKPNRGNIHILGTDITKLNPVACDQFRADHFGIIFQLFNLIPYLSVIENIILPCTFSKIKKKKALLNSQTLADEARRLCFELNIDDHLLHKPVNQLSIGQQQRVSIARAIIGQPDIIIADEATSALDQERTDQFMTLLLNECQTYNLSLIFVSHNKSLQSSFQQVYSLNHINETELETSHVLV